MTISIQEFEASCKAALDYVIRHGGVVTITRNGQVIAELGPPLVDHPKSVGPGFAKGLIAITGDIMAPLDVEWDVLKD